MWIIWALLAAVFSGVCVIFQKKVASAGKVLQTAAINVVIVVITVFLAALMRGKLPELALLSAKGWYLAAAAGLLQAASWIAYFLALRDANVSLFMVLDKTGIIFAMLMWRHYGTGVSLHVSGPRDGNGLGSHCHHPRRFSDIHPVGADRVPGAAVAQRCHRILRCVSRCQSVCCLIKPVYAQADGYFLRKPDVFNKESMLPIYVSKCSKTGSPCSPRRKSRSLQYAEKCAMGKIVETVV